MVSVAGRIREASSRRAGSMSVDSDQEMRVAFGSCGVAAPHEPPCVLERSEHRLGQGVDALRALGLRLREQPQ